MVGLLARESLTLSPAQMVAVAFNAWLWLSGFDVKKTSLVSLGMAGALWWGERLCLDTALTWQALEPLQGRMMSLSEMPNAVHMATNTPFWSWYVSVYPSYRLHQLTVLALSAVTIGLLWELYGERARLVLASPLWFLCCSQPLPVVYALGFVAMGRVLFARGRKLLAGVSILAALLLKYTAYVALPFVVWEFGGWSLLVFVGLAGFWGWFASTDSLLYARQSRFLLHHFGMGFHKGAATGFAWTSSRLRHAPYARSYPGGLFYLWPMFPLMRLAWLGGALLTVVVGKNFKYLVPLLACYPRGALRNAD